MGRLGIALGQILLLRADPANVQAALDSATWKFEQELRKDMDKSVLAKLGEPMGKPDYTTDNIAALAAGTSRKDDRQKRSVVVAFDAEGNATHSAVAHGDSVVEVCHGHAALISLRRLHSTE